MSFVTGVTENKWKVLGHAISTTIRTVLWTQVVVWRAVSLTVDGVHVKMGGRGYPTVSLNKKALPRKRAVPHKTIVQTAQLPE